MFTDERRQVILASLSVHGALSVSDLARMVRASDITIRRDLRILEESGQIVRRRGGATLSRSAMDEPTYRDKTVVASAEKAFIAREAATMVDDGDVIMLCAGTTTQALARLLRDKRIMVATNSLLVAWELVDAPNVEVLLIGGMMRGNIRAVIGGDAEKAIARMRFHKLFLSGNGLTAENGLMTPNVHVASIDKAAVDASKQVIVLADHTKVGVDSMVVTASPNRIDTCVTDRQSDPTEIAALRACGIDVRIAAAPHSELADDGQLEGEPVAGD